MFIISSALINDYLNLRVGIDSTSINGKNIWFVGFDYTIEEGLNNLISHLEKSGYILIDKPEVLDYCDCMGNLNKTTIVYMLLYQALPKLEYLAWRHKQRVGKNKKAVKV